jgi:cell division protein DivIC
MEVYNLKRKKVKRNFIIISLIYLVLGFLLMETVIKTGYELYTKSKEKREFTEELSILKEKEEELKGQVNKLQDPDYIARYAREKYLYSKDGEIIIRIPD